MKGDFCFGDWDAPITDGLHRAGRVPAGLRCMHCSETIRPFDSGAVVGGMPQHRECSLRAVLGGIGHLVNHAEYCRGSAGPDAGLPYRLSAQLVWSLLVGKADVTTAELEQWRTLHRSRSTI